MTMQVSALAFVIDQSVAVAKVDLFSDGIHVDCLQMWLKKGSKYMPNSHIVANRSHFYLKKWSILSK